MTGIARGFAVAAVAGIVVLVTAAIPADARRERFTVTSPAFGDREPIPVGFTCDGAGASVPLAWRAVPKATEELALIMDDPDAPTGTFVHWVAWGIAPKPRRLPEQTLPETVLEGNRRYLGPCPPRGDGPHRYRITVYALDEPPGVAAGSATADELRAAIKGHVLAKDRLVGTYER